MRIQFTVIAGALLCLTGCRTTATSDVEKGNRLFQAGKYVDASIEYRKAVQKEPAMAEAYYRLGLNVLRQGNSHEGYTILAKATSLAPERSDIKVTFADVCLELYLKEGAGSLYNALTKVTDEILAKDAHSFDGLRLKGTQALFDRKPGDAVRYLQEANQIKPLQPNVALVLAQALFQDNKVNEAEKLTRELIGKEKSFVAAYDLLFTQYLSQKRLVDAENILKLKVQNNPADSVAILQLARHYAANGRTSDMEATLGPLTSNAQVFADGRIQVAQFYKSLGKTEEALRWFEDGAKNDTKNAAVYRKGIINLLLDQGKQQEALDAVEALLRENPKDPESLALRATLWVDGNDSTKLDQAIADLISLQKEKPKDPNLRFNLGRAQWRKGNRAAAITEFREAARHRDTAVAANLALAEIGLEEQRPAETIRLTEEALQKTPNHPKLQLLHSAGLLGMGNVTGAKREIQALLMRYPNYRDAQLQLAFTVVREKKFKEAEEMFRRIYQSAGADVRPALGLAAAMTSQNQLDRAIQFLEEEIKKSPTSIPLRRTLAIAAAQAGKFDVAIAQYSYLNTTYPSSVDYVLELGALYERKNDLPKAIAYFEKAGEQFPKDARPFAFLANSLRRANRVAEARVAYQRAIDNAPGDPVLLNNLAFMLADSGGNLDSALRMAQRATQSAPAQPIFADTLGWIYLKQNKTDSALQVFNSLVNKHADNPTYHYHLGMAFLQKGDKPGAQKELEIALKKKPSSTEEAEIKQLLSR